MDKMSLLNAWLLFIPTLGTAIATYYLKKTTKTSEQNTNNKVDGASIKNRELIDDLKQRIDRLEKTCEEVKLTCDILKKSSEEVKIICDTLKKSSDEERVNYIRFSVKQAETLTDIRNVLYKNSEGKAQEVKQLDSSDLKTFGKVIIKE